MPSILMLHGWKNNLQSLQPLGALLAHHFRVHLIDLPGFGASAMHDGSWGTEEYAECIAQYAAANNLSNYSCLGHSFGARVAIRLASKYPRRIAALVLVSAAGLQPAGWTRVKRDWRRAKNRIFGKLYVSNDYRQAGELRTTFKKAVTEDLSDLASGIPAPTLLIYGAVDTDTPPEMGRRYLRLMQNAQFIELPDKDHFPFAGTGASLCATLIKNFFAKATLI